MSKETKIPVILGWQQKAGTVMLKWQWYLGWTVNLQIHTCGLSNSLQKNTLSNAELDGLVGRRKSIETQVDTVQEIVRTQRYHRTEQVAKDLDRLQPDNTAIHTHPAFFHQLTPRLEMLRIIRVVFTGAAPSLWQDEQPSIHNRYHGGGYGTLPLQRYRGSTPENV